MSMPFCVDATHINALSDLQLTKLLKLLLHLEVRSAGIAERSVDVALNINVKDGGEDGRVQWTSGPDSTNFIPSRFTQFQNKATDMGPKKCAEELVASDGTVKKRVDEALLGGATYVLFLTQTQNSDQKQNNIAEMRAKLRELGRPYAESVSIHIYDAGTISGWVNNFLGAVVSVLNWTGRPLERGLKTWADWGKDQDNQFPFVPDDARQQSMASLRSLLSKTRQCARIVGLSGLGKTRLAFEVFREVDDFDDLGKQVVYVDAAVNQNIGGLVTDWVQSRMNGIFVVDNCELLLHKTLSREVTRTDSQLC